MPRAMSAAPPAVLLMFWDSSAIVPRLVAETQSDLLTRQVGADTEPVIWWTTPLECQAAIQRRHREQAFTARSSRNERPSP